MKENIQQKNNKIILQTFYYKQEAQQLSIQENIIGNVYFNYKTQFQKINISVDRRGKLFIKLKEKLHQFRREVQIQPNIMQFKQGILSIKMRIYQQYIRLQTTQYSKAEQFYNKIKMNYNHIGFSNYFKPLRRLGKGAFATVYLVQNKINKNLFAAKVISKQAQNLQYKGKYLLQNQINILRHIQHQNILKLQGVYETDNLIYLVTQYLSGGTLQDYMKDKCKLSGEIIINIIKDILNGLKYLNQNIIHRDLKPANILLRQSDNKWVISDFGLACNKNENIQIEKCGTMGYIAPQILNNDQKQKKYDKCDLYSLGIIAYELIVGRLPFKIDNQDALNKIIVQDTFNNDQTNQIDESIILFLKRLLYKDQKYRYTIQQALNSNFLTNQNLIKNWVQFRKQKIDQRYRKILQIANIN